MQCHTEGPRDLCPICGTNTGTNLTRHMQRRLSEGCGGITNALDVAPITGDPGLDVVIVAAIRTDHYCRVVVDLLNIRTWTRWDRAAGHSVDARRLLVNTWNDINTRAKVNWSTGCVLEHKTSGELNYFHLSSNNVTLLAVLRVISSLADMYRLYTDAIAIDLKADAQRRRPSTAWPQTSYQYNVLHIQNGGHGASRLLWHLATGLSPIETLLDMYRKTPERIAVR